MASLPPKLLNALSEARERFAQGDVTGAIRLAEPVAQAAPGFAGAQTLLARAYAKVGETEKALARFRAAAEAGRNDPERWQEFVVELLKAGQKGRARNVAQKAPLKGPARKKLLDLAKTGIARGGAALGGANPEEIQGVQSLMHEGKLADARSRAEALLAKHPESAFVHNLLGVVALAEDNFDAAAASFRETLRLSPAFSGAAANLGFTLTRQGQLGAAISVLKEAANTDPTAVDVRTNLASAYIEAGFFGDAVKEAEKLLGLAPDNRNALHMLAHGLVKSHRHSEALPHIERLSELGDDGPDLQVLKFDALAGSGAENDALDYVASIGGLREDLQLKYSELLAEMGRFEDARGELRKVLSANPENYFAYYRYGSFARWTEDDPLLEPIRKATDPENATGPNSKGFAFYARAKAEIDMKLDADVFPALHAANKLQAQGIHFDPNRYHDDGRSIMDVWTAAALEKLSRVGVTGVRPIFIVGMPRSGSTLVDRILSAHPQVTSVGEESVLDKIFPFDMPADRTMLHSAANKGLAAIVSSVGRSARYLDKYLANFLRVGMLAAAYPNAVFLRTRRDPRSIALSIYSNALKANTHPYSTSLEGIAAFYLYCEGLMDHWQELLGDRIINVVYEDLVGEPEPHVRALLDNAGLPWDAACLSPETAGGRVKTLSIRQARSGINAASLERWRRFEDDLRPFVRTLEKAGAL